MLGPFRFLCKGGKESNKLFLINMKPFCFSLFTNRLSFWRFLLWMLLDIKFWLGLKEVEVDPCQTGLHHANIRNFFSKLLLTSWSWNLTLYFFWKAILDAMWPHHFHLKGVGFFFSSSFLSFLSFLMSGISKISEVRLKFKGTVSWCYTSPPKRSKN